MRKRRPPASNKLLTAQAAAAALGVPRRTVYSYVSRGLIGVSKKSVVGRGSLYDAADVEVLRDRKRRGRSHAAIAASTIQFGEPVLETGLTRIRDSHLSYRGHDAVVLSEDGTLEDVAGLLWLMPPPLGAEEVDLLAPDAASGFIDRCRSDCWRGSPGKNRRELSGATGRRDAALIHSRGGSLRTRRMLATR